MIYNSVLKDKFNMIRNFNSFLKLGQIEKEMENL